MKWNGVIWGVWEAFFAGDIVSVGSKRNIEYIAYGHSSREQSPQCVTTTQVANCMLSIVERGHF